ncbi:Pentatricopeptide repeat-containing protein [Striga hermonthica]|uniref:Pentatricopeptide repeat-containing protein n=1 Tax=Striga hermonthica TaxID=68872 RepID=A0A9N7RJ41_STRHE|nr:Pentatricopeptide repeat-containing protein [Striga hermonthica]
MQPPLTKAHLIPKCAVTKSLREARRLHALLITSPCADTESPLLHNNILSMYARCGSFVDTQRLFDKMPHPNIVSYNALISAYSRSPHHAHLAYRLLSQLENENLKPNRLTITSLLQASAGLRDVVLGSVLHSRSVKIGVSNNASVQTSLLGMYSKCGDVGCAEKVFHNMMDKDDIAWNSMISNYIKNGRIMGSLDLYKDMLRDRVNPTRFTYSLMLNACAKLEDYDHGKIVHAHVLISGTYVDLPLHNSLLDMYCSCRDTRSACNVFSRIRKPDLISWNSMIGGFSDSGDGKKAMYMFVRLMGVSPYRPDEYSFAAVISGTSLFPARDYGKPLHAQIEKTGLEKSVYIGSTLASMYFNNDDFLSSRKILDSFPHKDTVLWTDMIAGHVRTGQSENALRLFQEMFENGCKADSFALSSALSACAELVTLNRGEMIHCLAVKTGNESDVSVHSSLVDMYAKNGELKSAAHTFCSLPRIDLMCWNSMLTAYAHHGRAHEVFQVFFKMLKSGLSPDQVTLLSLLSACNHCGLVEKSRYFWNYMKENGIRPGPKHYSCVVSVLSRVGLWEEAEGLITELPFSDENLELWMSVLSSCVKNENVRGGVYAARRVLEINGKDSAANVLLAKLYGGAGKWGHVMEMRRLMMPDKEPGLSWVEV